MDTKDYKENIEIKSEEVQEIMGHIPHWFLRVGISIIFGLLVFSLILAYFIKYPDILTANVAITTNQPPVNIFARTTGKIDTLLVHDKEYIKQNDILATIDNIASYQDVMKLKKDLNHISENILGVDSVKFLNFKKKNYVLGDIQDKYFNLIISVYEYNNFFEISFHNKKINKLEQQKLKQKEFYVIEERQNQISREEYLLSIKQFERDSILFVQEFIALSEYEKSANTLLGKKNTLENSNKSLINCELQINQLDQQILDLKLDFRNKLEVLKNDLQQSIANLDNAIKNWEFNYILKSPTDGKVVFTRMWSNNQNVSTGNTVFTIIPEKDSKIIGKLILPVSGAGKVKLNQTVNIKLHNYPYKEFGMVTGKVYNISDVPVDSVYFVDISLPDGLVTSYNKKLHFSQGMTGQAEIITENINLLARFIQPLKAIFKNNF